MKTQTGRFAMLGELRFKVGSWTEIELVKRLSLLLCGDSDFKPCQKGAGNASWVLDWSNNWWLLVQDGVARLTYRYPQGKPAEFFPALSLVIRDLVGLNSGETADVEPE